MNAYIDSCSAAITKALGKDMSIEELEDEMMKISNAIQGAIEKGKDPKAAATATANDLVRSAERSAMKAKANAYKNKLTEWEVMKQVDATHAKIKGKKSLYTGIRGIISGMNTVVEGSQRSADAMSQSMKNEYTSALITRLDNEGLTPTFTKGMVGDMEEQVAEAIKHLNTKNAVGNVPRVKGMSNAGYTDAVKIGKILTELQETMRLRLNRAGADIPRLSGFIGHQVHDQGRMLRGGFEKWKTKIEPLLDWDKMNVTNARRSAFLKSAFDAMSTGVRREIGSKQPLAEGFKGPANLARSLSHSRLLHFKTSEGWLSYGKEFGSGGLRESLTADIAMSAKNVAVLERMTTNPEAFLDGIIEKVSQKYRDTDPDAVRYLRENWSTKSLHNDLDVVTGAINIGSQTTIAKTGEWLRAIKTMASLGGTLLSSFADVVFGSNNRMYQGRNFAQAWGDAFIAPFMRMGSKERKHIADLLGVGLEMRMGAMISRFSADDITQGETSGMLQAFFKLNLLAPWTDANKAGQTMMISHDLAISSKKSLDKLSDAHKRLLKIYAIDSRQWDVIRSAARTAEDGNEYILPGDIDDVSGPMFNGLSKFQQNALKEKARENLFLLYSNESNIGVPTPGAREQSILKQGVTPDSVLGQAMRMMAQFKAFPVTALSKVAGRTAYGGGSNMMMINLIVNGTIGGMAIVQLKEMAKGREPLAFDHNLLIRGALQGGALGIYGDLLLNKHSEYGGTIFSTLAGPVPNDFNTILKITQDLVLEGDTSTFGRDAIKLVKGITPGANLFYTKLVTDYLIWDQLQEMANPGYKARKAKDLKNRTGQGPLNLPIFGGGG